MLNRSYWDFITQPYKARGAAERMPPFVSLHRPIISAKVHNKTFKEDEILKFWSIIVRSTAI